MLERTVVEKVVDEAEEHQRLDGEGRVKFIQREEEGQPGKGSSLSQSAANFLRTESGCWSAITNRVSQL